MSITVREILNLKEWENCRVIAGCEGLDRKISCVDTMEVPNIIPWLREDELLITTAYAIKDNEEALLDILQAFEKNQSSGIALKTRFLGTITDKIKKEADRLNIPLIVIPKETPTIDLINPLMKRIADNQTHKLEFSKDMNEKFLAVQIEGGSFEEIGSILGGILNCRVIVTDSRKNVIYCFPETLEEEGVWITEGAYGEKKICDRLMMCQEACGDKITETLTDDLEIWTHAIYVKQQCKGYLYVIGNKGQFNEMNRIAVHQAAVYLALEFSKQGLKEQKEYYQDNNFFLDLINANITMEEDAVRRAGGLRWPVFPYHMAVSDIDGFERLIRGKSEEEVQVVKEELMQIHRDVLRKEPSCFFVGNKSDSFHCLFTRQADKEAIKSCLTEVQEQAFKIFNVRMTAGVSREINHYYDFEKAYTETRMAIDIGKKTKEKKICFIEDLRMEEAFSEMAKMQVFQEFVTDTLQVLEDYDKEHGSRLLETLAVLTENLGAKQETADALYLHRNTLSYRIRQIEQLTGYDLSDSKVLFRLQLAIKVHMYMKI